MATPKSDFLRVLSERGFIHQCTDIEALDARLMSGPITAYIGFDCTADSLHVGSLVQIMLLRWLQKSGHKPIVLMGRATTRIGDPSGKDESRELLNPRRILKNKDAISQTFERLLKNDKGQSKVILVDNLDWLARKTYLTMLREYGRHFSISRMLSFDSVKLRLDREQNLSFLEFNYMVLQAYDFLELAREFDCELQMGGSDQWGNIVNGVELGRRADRRKLFGLTAPLITTADGAKMGKTAEGAVWLNADRLSPYHYWQFWRDTQDADIGRFLRLFTELPLSECDRLAALEGAETNEAKKVLAFETTKILHGEAAAAGAAETARQTFAQGGAGAELPTIDLSKSDLETGIPAYELMRRAGLAASNGEARRLIKGGGGRVNDVALTDETQSVSLADLNDDGLIKLSAGKKRHALVRAV